MSTQLKAAAIPQFAEWLATRRPLGLAATDRHIAIGDSSGRSWVLNRADLDTTRIALIAIAESGRRVWAEGASQVAVRLAKTLGLDVAAFSWLHDATTARNVVHPGGEFAPTSLGAARESVSLARFVTELPRAALPATRTAVMDSCAQDQLWRPRQAKGWRVDVDLLDAELRTVTENRERSIAELGINLTATATGADKAAIHAWLAGADIFITDKDGAPTLDRNEYDETPIPDTDEARLAWSQFRRVRSIASRGAKLMEIKRALRGGRIYSTVQIRSARTGRGGVVRPALQNINRDLRPLLIADEGETLISLDFAQVEPRVAAGLSGDAALLAALESGDLYAELAKTIWKSGASDVHGVVIAELRQHAKALMLGVFYGKGPRAMARELGVDTDTAQRLLLGIWDAYPELKSYSKRLEADVKANRSELTTGGRPIPPPRLGPHAVLNNRVQAEASDVFYEAVARVAKVLGAEALYLGVHDELVVSVPGNQTAAALLVLEREMNTIFRGVPIRGTASELGRSWRKA